MSATGRAYATAGTRYLGTHEQRAGSVWTNRQIFGARFGWNGVAWCSIFTWCVADDVGAGALVPRTASCPQGVKWFKARGQWHGRDVVPHVGDLIYFGTPAHHVGIVTRVRPDLGTLAYVSGNSNDGTAPADTGNAVTVKPLPLNSTTIAGYGRPRWPKRADRPPARPVDEPPARPVDEPPARPVDEAPARPAKGSTPRVWITRKRATLTSIATALGVSVSVLLAGNPSLNILDPGTHVAVPRVSVPVPTPQTTASASPRPGRTTPPSPGRGPLRLRCVKGKGPGVLRCVTIGK